MNNDAEPAEPVAPEPPAKKRKVWPVILGILAVVALTFGYRSWRFNAVHVSTDDAQVTSTIVSVSPQVAGTVLKVHVVENQPVKAGDLVAELDPESYITAVQQAEANLALALAQSKQATASLDLTDKVGNAQILQAQGQLDQTQSAVSGSQAEVSRAEAAVASARAQASGTRATTAGAIAAVRTAEANLHRAQDAVTQAQTLVENARSSAKAATANVDTARANLGKAERDAERAQALFKEGVISAQAADQATTQLSVTRSQLVAAQEQAQSAQTLIAQRQAEVATARSQVEATVAQIAQAKAQLQASRDQSAAADQAVRQATAQVRSAQTGVQQAVARTQSAAGGLAQANTAPVQIQISKVGQEQADARIALARAALADAQLKLRRTKIFASVTGRISRKTLTLGQSVQVGSPLMAIVPDGDRTVAANFKETQLANVRVGQPAEIEVDAMPGVVFKGHVDSLSAGTGATFALLPPDNATGNFTKVVQRVPVKIVFEPGQPRFDDLRAGMSVVATIDTHGGRE